MTKKTIYQKVILSGGYVSRAVDGGVAFCKEIIANPLKPTRVLECFFGLADNAWSSAMEKDQKMFNKMVPDVRLEFQIASWQSLVDQIKWADVIYFRGGETQKLYNYLNGISGWQEALIGKVVVGASAGAYILSELYVPALEPPSLKKGFGLIPVKIVTHYRSTFLHNGNKEESNLFWDQVDKIMDGADPKLEKIQLREGEFKVL